MAALQAPLPPRSGATEPEEAVFAQLIERWIPVSGPSVSSHQLFPYTLLKSFLSSHRALDETIATRQATLRRWLLREKTDPRPRRNSAPWGNSVPRQQESRMVTPPSWPLSSGNCASWMSDPAPTPGW